MSSRIGGRILQYSPGMQQYDKDVYRGERRRPWFILRFGQHSLELNRETFSKFVEKVQTHFMDRGFLLDSEFLENRCDLDESYQSLEEARLLLSEILKQRDQKYERGIMSIPIGLVVLDFHDCPEADSVLELYEKETNNCYFDGKDIVNAILNNDFEGIFEHCDKFIETMVINEDIPQSLAVKKELIMPSEFGSTPVQMPSTSRQPARMNDQYNNSRDRARPMNPRNFTNQNNRQQTTRDSHAPPSSVPPGLGPPGLSKRTGGFRAQTPPGLRLPTPPGLRRRNAIDDFDESESDVEEEPIPHSPPPPPQQILQLCSIEDIQVALKYVKHIPNLGELAETDTDLAKRIAVTKLFNRFDVIFDTARDNFEFLVVVNYASSSIHPEARSFIEKLMSNCFNYRYPNKVVNDFIKPCVRNKNWDFYTAQLVFELTFLFGYLCRLRPTINRNILQCWREFWNITNDIIPNDILRVCSDVNPEDYEYQEDLCRCINDHIDKDRAVMKRDERRHEQREVVRNRNDEHERYPENNYDDSRYDSRRHEVENHGREKDERRYESDDYERHRRENDGQYFREQNNGRCDNDRHEREEAIYRSPSSSYNSNDNQENYSGGRNVEKYQERSSAQQQPLREPTPVQEDDVRLATQPYKFSENVRNFCDQPDDSIVLLWKKCEKIEPPNDFREMSILPKLSDYFEPEEPYLRRICDDGVYANLQHYLDVQYRLMREDLVSPLRDGIDIYRRNGSTRGNRIPNVINSDLTIYRVDRIEGKQASPRGGLEMRYCHLSSQTMIQLRSEGKQFRGGNLVLLSCDRFEKDMHLACLNEFKEERGIVSIIILEEMTNQRIETSKPYLMAEATSYLPAYNFVLENMQKINKFSPIPFQRYLLHRKVDFFRPAYQRQEKTESQVKYEAKMENHFNEVRSEVVKKRMIEGRKIERKKKTKKNKKSKNKENWDDNFSDEDFRQVSEDSDSCDSDSELYWLSKPMFKKPIGYLSAEDGDRMRINGKWYSISRLLSEFMPENMDDSQRVAFCNSFQREFSIIQGPPGTGKTHIGVEIVKAMLKNRQHFRMTEPILIVCYTNSAIDQFLERIFMMISEDEELSRDDGKPKIIRFGSKSDSQIIAKNRLLREHVMSDYRTSNVVDQTLVTEMNSSFKDRNNRETELATSSYGLYASRKSLLSFGILNRVMLHEFQKELRDWAVTHTDTKNMVLSTDEALACWLLDTEFGRSKNPLRTASKFSNLTVEETLSNTCDEDSELENDDLTNEEILNKMFEKININCAASDLNDAKFDENEIDGFLSESPWDIAANRARNVVLLNKRTKVVGNNDNIPVDNEIVERIQEEEALILKTPPMSNEEVADVKFIFSLTRPKRWALYQYWCKVLRKTLCEIIPRYMETYKTSCLKVKKCLEKVDASVSKSAMIIGCTTSGCSKLRSMLERVKPKILIVEEAAEVLESHILSAMISSVEHVVMIGDHQQLRPNPAVHELGTEYGLQISMFERLVERGLPFSQLKEQHRMNTNIADLIVRPSFYPNVHDSENVKHYPPVEGLAENLYFWSHCEREQSHDGSSWYNLQEVEMVCGLVQHLLKQSYTPEDITVITTYSAQKLEMLRRFQQTLGGSIEEPRVPVETVDSFQGQENKIVIVSLVRSHRGQRENTGIGFLAVKNRICVALTRAKYGMYIVGNGAYIKNNAKLWANIVDSLSSRKLIEYHINVKCTAHGKIEEIESPQDFATFSPEGGCSQMCDIQKLCGHFCRKRCHPNVESIHLQPCYYECQKLCPKNHGCKKKCYEECGNCMEYVEIKLKCGHTIITPCFNSESAVCDQRCSMRIECGHQCFKKCGDECTKETECKEIINHNLKCGHVQKIECSKYVEGVEEECVERCTQKMLGCDHQCKNICGQQCPIQCEEPVEVKLSCGHQLEIKCHEVSTDGEIDEELHTCSTLIRKTLEPCRHEVNVRCGDEPITEFCYATCRKMLSECGHECGDVCSKCFTTGEHRCQTRCTKVLECGHMCTSKCGEKCAPCQSFCETSCSHMSCGISNMGYGRECRKLCVLCTNNCQNKCCHRSCDRKCFEECSVAVCNERCKMALKCGHGCLGMCGETCPNVCGTCNRKGYDEVVNVMGKENVKIYRLVQLQHCSHVFPVEFLDEYVEKRKATSSKLVCPKDGCDKQFGDVWRYAKYSKRMVLDKNRIKFRQSVNNSINDYNEKYEEMKEIVESSTQYMKSINDNMTGTTKAVRAMCSNFVSFALDTFPNRVKNRATTLENVEFYRQIAICVRGMAYLYHSILYVRVNRNKMNYPPITDQFVIDIFTDTDMFNRQMKCLDELLNELVKVLPFEFVGAIIPKMRYSLARINCVLQLMVVCRKLLTEQVDMTTTFANSLKSACLDLFKQNEKIDLSARIESIEKLIIGQFPSVAKTDSFRKWESYGIPQF